MNAIGDIVKAVDSMGRVTCTAYDAGGRVVKRIYDYQGSDFVGCSGDDSNPLLYSYEYDGGSDRTVLMKTPEHEMYSIYDEYHRMINSVSKIDGRNSSKALHTMLKVSSNRKHYLVVIRLIITMIITVTLYPFQMLRKDFGM